MAEFIYRPAAPPFYRGGSPQSFSTLDFAVIPCTSLRMDSHHTVQTQRWLETNHLNEYMPISGWFPTSNRLIHFSPSLCSILATWGCPILALSAVTMRSSSVFGICNSILAVMKTS